jgi:hypothetical protein
MYDHLYHEDELDEEFDEPFDTGEEDDDYPTEARRRSPKVARGDRYARRPARGKVSRSEMQSALDHVSKDMRANAKAIKTLSAQQAKDASYTRKGLRQNRNFSLLTFLLNQHPATQVQTIPVPQNIRVTDPANDNRELQVTIDGTNQLVTAVQHQNAIDNNLIFLFLLMGMGGMGGGDKNSEMNDWLPFVLLLTQGQGNIGANNLAALLPVLLLANNN